MPEGVAVAGGGPVVSGAVHDDPGAAPAPGPDAPKGWTWNRSDRVWRPKQRGPVVWQPGASPGPPSGADAPGSADHLGKDPAPGWMSDDDGQADELAAARTARRMNFSEVPAQVKADAASFAALVGAPLLALARTVDPYCGGILADNFAEILDASLPIICRSERVVRFFTSEDSDWLLWLKLAMTLGPVAQAIAQHHVFHTVSVVRDPETGAVSVVRGQQDGQGGDHLTPPVVTPDAYAA